MRRSGGYCRLPGCGLFALAAAVMPVSLPAEAGSASYEDAFERRVSNAGDRDALDAFVAEAAGRGQYDQALSTLEEVLLRDPDDLRARLALARIYFQIGSFDMAAAHVEQAELTAGAEQFARQIAELRGRIERALAGYEVGLAITSGVEYNSQTVTMPALASKDGASGFGPYAMIEGHLIRHLDTASRDELRFGGFAKYNRVLGDTDYDGVLDEFDQYALRAEATYSKGLPDIIDTLRLDLSVYGQAKNYGDERDLREYGTEARLSFQPTVESRLGVHAGYGWLGKSNGIYGERRVNYGLNGEIRVAPGVAIGAHVTGYTEWGTAPYMFVGGGQDYTENGYEVGASVAHLLHVFDDGRSWVQEAGGSYSHARILDHGALTGFFAAMANQDRWDIFWNHTVQIATHADFSFGVSYGHEEISDTVAPIDGRVGDSWSVRTGLTFRFN
ncbi:tetratricopeptide repeat protein [Oricola thermophila]|uniref:Tetratricopeptide repeat protein n=1 Tax=Oricola thermophila TaxID=2742145 RepID=A0A6N1V9G3_9HYPH|nr:tetratricopeptide repeat protein [Oricola thermophila]QKV17163.1 tetratricopeptide repeat protein [Oricola thermophila]